MTIMLPKIIYDTLSLLIITFRILLDANPVYNLFEKNGDLYTSRLKGQIIDLIYVFNDSRQNVKQNKVNVNKECKILMR